jgi:hypothetical protein
MLSCVVGWLGAVLILICGPQTHRGEPVLTIANILIGIIALLHIYILVPEIFLWHKPAGLRAFGQEIQIF